VYSITRNVPFADILLRNSHRPCASFRYWEAYSSSHAVSQHKCFPCRILKSSSLCHTEFCAVSTNHVSPPRDQILSSKYKSVLSTECNKGLFEPFTPRFLCKLCAMPRKPLFLSCSLYVSSSPVEERRRNTGLRKLGMLLFWDSSRGALQLSVERSTG